MTYRDSQLNAESSNATIGPGHACFWSVATPEGIQKCLFCSRRRKIVVPGFNPGPEKR